MRRMQNFELRGLYAGFMFRKLSELEFYGELTNGEFLFIYLFVAYQIAFQKRKNVSRKFSYYRKCGSNRWDFLVTGWKYSCWLVERWSHDYHLVKLVSGWLWQPKKSFSITGEKSSKISSTSVCIRVGHKELLELKQFEKKYFLYKMSQNYLLLSFTYHFYSSVEAVW